SPPSHGQRRRIAQVGCGRKTGKRSACRLYRSEENEIPRVTIVQQSTAKNETSIVSDAGKNHLIVAICRVFESDLGVCIHNQGVTWKSLRSIYGGVADAGIAGAKCKFSGIVDFLVSV